MVDSDALTAFCTSEECMFSLKLIFKVDVGPIAS
jgi:hypothetical protein